MTALARIAIFLLWPFLALLLLGIVALWLVVAWPLLLFGRLVPKGGGKYSWVLPWGDS